MKWKKYTIETTAEAVDHISWMLAENGIEGIEIEDSEPLTEQDYAEMFADILPEPPVGDGSAKVHFYMDEDETDAQREEKLSAIREGLKEIAGYVDAGSCSILEGEMDEADWRDKWKEGFHSFKVADMLIHPTWEPEADASGTRYQIEIDPGAAFGTGSHETTRLCLQHLRRYMQPGDKVLDVGTGSGILSIAALKRGASFAMATDLDPQAVETSLENVALNGYGEDRYKVIKGNVIDDPAVQQEIGGDYDVVLANILAPAIIALQDMIFRHMKRGAVFIASGIIDAKEEDVLMAFEANPYWELVEVEHDGEWVGITARKR